MKWVMGCTPRITVIACDEDVRNNVRMGKVLSFLSQLSFVYIFARQLCKKDGRSGTVGVASSVCLAIAGCGALHSASIMVPFPNSTQQDGLMLCVEFLYTGFNVFLIAALFIMNSLWLEFFHPEAFPQAGELSAFYQRTSRRFSLALASVVGVTGVVTDVMLAILQTELAYEAVVHIQHNTFMLVCLMGASVSFVASSRLVGTCGGAGRAGNLEAARCMLGARNVILFLWVFCLLFCTGCAGLSTDKHTRGANPSSTVDRFVWAMHSSFILMGGGAFASVIYMLIHRRSIFASFSCMSVQKAVDSSQIPASDDATIDAFQSPEVLVVSAPPEEDMKAGEA